MWMGRGNVVDCADSCLNCKIVRRCSHVREVALSIFLNVRVLSTSASLFEITAEQCETFIPHKKRAIRLQGSQMKLFEAPNHNRG